MKTSRLIYLLCLLLVAFALPQAYATSLTSPVMVTAHTAGEISRTSVIQVKFTDNMAQLEQLNQPLAVSPLTFTPDIPGTVLWTEQNTLEFRPAQPLPAGQKYAATVNFSTFIKNTEAPEPFLFEFIVKRQAIEITVDGLEAVNEQDAAQLKLRGTLTTSDAEDEANIPKLLTATQDGASLTVEWAHYGNNHPFTVTGILRKEAASDVILTWNGAPVGSESAGTQNVSIPAAGPFQALSARAIKGAEQYIEIRFSDPLKVGQDLKGLIQVSDYEEYYIRAEIDGSLIKVYGRERWDSPHKVTVVAGVKNSFGFRLSQQAEFDVDFTETLPQARFVGNGIILPSSAGLTIPIETYNLKQVIVEAMQVFDKNMPQFLQVNNLDSGSSRELQRVGRVVWQNVVDLDFKTEQQNNWVRHGLDLTPLVQNFPGGMYTLTLSFQRPNVVYQCPDAPENEEVVLPEISDAWDTGVKDRSSWDYYEDCQGDNWDECYYNRGNPCYKSYYMKYYNNNVEVSRNVLVSDIGLIAKRALNDVTVFATDLKTALPLEGVEIELLDYQQLRMSMAKTDINGKATLHFDRKPFVAVAHLGDQAGFLKLDDGSALSLSSFDVGGEEVKKGIKGMIYGERGVWRPGDTMYLTFLLWDQEHALPKGHPVVFELLNPQGQLVKTIKAKESLNGFYPFPVATAPDAPTGNWMARVRVGGVTFEQPLKVETVMPNRLKINLSFGENLTSLSSGDIQGELSATWLHGAIAKNLNADTRVTFTQRPTKFSTYTDYIFDDPTRTYSSEESFIFEGTLDEEGKAPIDATIKTENTSPGMLNANFFTRVFEDSGTFSSDRFTLPYNPYDRYVGLRLPKGDVARGMLLTDTKHPAAVVMLDKDGKPVSSAQVNMTLYKLNWQWWWEDSANYVEKLSNEPIAKGVIDIKDGVGEWLFEVKYPDWGRYFVYACDAAGGHCTGKVVYIDWPGWAGRSQKEAGGGAANILTISSDKPQYVVGEKIVLTIPAGKAGRGLVSIEAGNKVIQSAWVDGSEKETRYEFFATRDMAPNVYANVTFLQPHKQKENDLPIRLYGVIPLLVEDPATKLLPQLEAPEELTPEQTAQISVSETQGKPMTYTVAIVDEGLLGLTRFETPAPWKHFYKRVALSIKTWDLYDLVADATSGVLNKLIAIGGGDNLRGGEKKANRFPPMVRFYGPFELPAGAKNTHVIDVPQYFGQVRIMVVAGQNDAFGSAEKSVFVRKPLMLLGTLPRVLGPDEAAEMPVSIFAMDAKIKDVTVKVTAEEPLQIVGDAEKTLTFAAPGDDMVRFNIKTASKTGIGRVKIEAISGDETATQQIELDVRLPGGEVTDVFATHLTQGERWEQEVAFPGMEGTNVAMLELSRIPPLNLGKRLFFLIHYPYGCIEQTTSSVFPQVYLNTLLELSPAQQAEIQKNVSAGISRLQSFQTGSGGFAYWPGEANASEWGTNYAGHFLIEAEKAGYVLPPSMLDRWKRYQREKAANWEAGASQAELMQAYRLYTLALAGAAELGAMNRLREAENLPTTARWQLAAAYALAGQPEAAAQLVEKASLSVPKYNELSNTYGSDIRDKAMILDALSLMKRMNDALPLVKELSEALSSNEWLSTQATAYTLTAIARHAGVSGDAGGKKIECRVSWNGGEAQPVMSEALIAQIPLTISGGNSGNIVVENIGQGGIYPRVIVSGIPAPGTEQAAENGMTLTVNYTTLDNYELDPTAVEQGTDMVVIATAKNTSAHAKYDEVALAQIFPSGWEIRNVRLDAPGQGDSKRYDYQDIRDDRIYTHFDINPGETKVFKVQVHAAYLGKYYLPMTTVEAMYDATINARVPGRWSEVVAAGTASAEEVASRTLYQPAAEAESNETSDSDTSESEEDSEPSYYGVQDSLAEQMRPLFDAGPVLVLDFTNLQGRVTGMGVNLADNVTNELRNWGEYTFLRPTENLWQHVSATGFEQRTPEVLAQFKEATDAVTIVTGMYLIVGNRFHITASAWNADTGECAGSQAVSLSNERVSSYSGWELNSIPFADVVKTAWKNMNLATDHGTTDPWAYPENSLRDVYYRLKTFAEFGDVANAFGEEVFLSGPHTNAALNLEAQDDFGHYNPAFVVWVGETLIPGAADSAFRETTQAVYDEYFRKLARNAYFVYRKMLAELKSDPNAMEAQKQAYLEAIKTDNILDCALSCTIAEAADLSATEEDFDSYLACSISCFLVRRSIDGTFDEFYSVLLKLLKAYDSEFLSANP